MFLLKPQRGEYLPFPMLREVAESYEECHRITREAHSNFYPAFFLLPKPKRDAIVAFMRSCD